MWGGITAATAVFSDDAPPPNLNDVVERISPRPVFFIYAERGQGGEDLSQDFYESAGEPKDVWEVPVGGHVGGAEARPREYERRMIGFFDDALLEYAPSANSLRFPAVSRYEWLLFLHLIGAFAAVGLGRRLPGAAAGGDRDRRAAAHFPRPAAVGRGRPADARLRRLARARRRRHGDGWILDRARAVGDRRRHRHPHREAYDTGDRRPGVGRSTP